ncbi:MAG: PD-(D/E)XK nuclease family protein [Verrucomicrobiota bacterium]
MPARVFLGWDRPFLVRVVEWLLDRRAELPGLLVVVPTAESGRRLREALAEAGGALLSPQFATPGSFLKIEDSLTDVAPDWAEQVGWVEVLEGVGDWSAYAGLFPEAPAADGEWAAGLARELVQLRRTLQESALTLNAAARRLRDTVEAERWEALGRLEGLVERTLASWGYRSRSRLLAAGFTLPAGVSNIVVAGVAEMAPLVEQALLAWEIGSDGQQCSGALRGPLANEEQCSDGHRPPLQRLTVLIGAPEGEADGFSAIGRPLAGWCERSLPWPEGTGGSVRVVADPRQQAVEALRVIGEAGSASNEVALGTADAEAGEELARALTRDGWPAFHPATVPATAGLARWFKVWGDWLAEPTLAVMADLLTLPDSAVLIGGRRAQKAQRLSEMRERWMVMRTEDLQRRIDAEVFRSEPARAAALEVLAAAIALEKWRLRFLRDDFTGALADLLDALTGCGPASAAMAATLDEWMAQAAPVIGRVRRGARFWLTLMLGEVAAPAPLPPVGRVIDVHGWLDLYYEAGRHLVLCGMNEGKVPARSGGEPWLSETARDRLGLITDAMRAARDAFLYKSMAEARHPDGRVDVICGKTGAGGETLLPSRLLLAAGRSALPLRVATLFREIEPPEAGLRWHADWQWSLRKLEPPRRISVTAITDYLACPLRFYLKHVVAMRQPETARVEWNARDFGTAAHEVLERWGKDEEAREFDKTEALAAWLSAELDRVVAEWFGKRVPMAVRIQAESLRQRLAWLARKQACERAAGWQVVDVERKVELAVGAAMLVAKIDRIDRHRDSGELRVIDYKTGKVDGVEKAHRSKLLASTVLAAHLADSPALHERAEHGKVVAYRWVNLQLPLYALALVRRDELLPRPCYFTLGATDGDVGLQEWADFTRQDLDAAQACAEWVEKNISSGIFTPPAERVSYDDYRILGAGRPLHEAMLLG